MSGELQGKVAIITGGSSGIGKGSARRFGQLPALKSGLKPFSLPDIGQDHRLASEDGKRSAYLRGREA